MLLATLDDVQERIVKAVGMVGAVKLAVLAAYRPILLHTNEINSDIRCDGETYKGQVPFQQLIEDGLFSTRRGFTAYKELDSSTLTLDDIALALPFLPMMWLLEHKAQGKHTFVDSVPNIQTSLPLELQYIQAAALPLYPRTRVAHINFTIRALNIKGYGFNIEVYKSLMSASHRHAQRMPGLVPALKEIERKLGPFNDDEKQAKVLFKCKFGHNHQ
ncbi:hypothetical protein V8B55DRAFT_1323916 [Mucor lusitanicus]|uniref:Uncharacterized protein n=2 Tax=Mucor circinelloides f. lusitanicus TaxID=29924 RepID=A0A168H828_MUCCL|nr:hypothetical protein FB192DRAFT_1342759 [Mucor lusitanicus]OAC98477.1 hypothetical protein MUCCIDRAFT_167555 [Mucor lusitanicus CBS 277.49]